MSQKQRGLSSRGVAVVIVVFAYKAALGPPAFTTDFDIGTAGCLMPVIFFVE
jgi:hypothetical protein